MVRRVPVIGTITLREKAVMQIAIPLFPKVTALDAIRPYEVLQRVPQLDIAFVGHARGEVRTDNGLLGLDGRQDV